MNVDLFELNGRSPKRSIRNVLRSPDFKGAGILLAMLVVGGLAGCGATRPMQYYQLTVPPDIHHAETNASGISLALGPLVASHLYREDRIVFSAGPQQMGTYEFQRWTEPPAEMIQEVLLRQLRASNRYREVFTQRSASRSRSQKSASRNLHVLIVIMGQALSPARFLTPPAGHATAAPDHDATNHPVRNQSAYRLKAVIRPQLRLIHRKLLTFLPSCGTTVLSVNRKTSLRCAPHG